MFSTCSFRRRGHLQSSSVLDYSKPDVLFFSPFTVLRLSCFSRKKAPSRRLDLFLILGCMTSNFLWSGFSIFRSSFFFVFFFCNGELIPPPPPPACVASYGLSDFFPSPPPPPENYDKVRPSPTTTPFKQQSLINIQGWTLNLNWSDIKVKTKNWHCCLWICSVQFFSFFDLSRA